MKEIKVSDDCILKIYSSAQELPLDRYIKFQRYLLLETGIGNTIESVVTHFEKLHKFLGTDRKDDAMLEVENLHYNFYAILQEINYTSLAFCCLIHTINGKPIEDFSEDSLKKTVTELSEFGLAQGTVAYENEELKKNYLMS